MCQYTIRIFRPYPLTGRFCHVTQHIDATDHNEVVAMALYFLGRYRGEFAHILNGAIEPDAEAEVIGEAFAPGDIAAADRCDQDRLERNRLKRVLKDPALKKLESDPQKKQWVENYRAEVLEKINGAR
jgi:hypothetical protein